MQENHDVAPSLFPCNPLAREFPPEWKDVWFRRKAVRCDDGVFRFECPLCHHLFDHSDIAYLQGDHIWPYSLCGESSWANYQLICGSCNASKNAFIDSQIRSILGGGEFRRMVVEYLRKAIEAGSLGPDIGLLNLLPDDGAADLAGGR